MRSPNSTSSAPLFVKLQTSEDIEKFRIAGKVVAAALTNLENLVKEKTTLTLKELDLLTKDYIVSQNCLPTFLGYRGFPATCCMSVNKQLVHGIPNDYVLQEGDLISFDLGATFENTIADSAITCIYGKAKYDWHTEIIQSSQLALYAGIKAMKPGNRIGTIGHAIYKSARLNGFKVVDRLGGHGVSDILHDDPFIPNSAEINEGIRMQAGNMFAIEPLLVPNNSSTVPHMAEDNWTVMTKMEGSHHEHSVALFEGHVEILTKRDGESIDRIYCFS